MARTNSQILTILCELQVIEDFTFTRAPAAGQARYVITKRGREKPQRCYTDAECRAFIEGVCSVFNLIQWQKTGVISFWPITERALAS